MASGYEKDHEGKINLQETKVFFKSEAYDLTFIHLLHHSRRQRVRLHVMDRDEGDAVLDAQVLCVVGADP